MPRGQGRRSIVRSIGSSYAQHCLPAWPLFPYHAVMLGRLKVVACATLMTVPLCAAAQEVPSRQPQPFAIRVDQPARIGFPMWVYSDLQGPLAAPYPFEWNLRSLGANRLELRHNGEAIEPLGISGGVPTRRIAGAALQGRLPLHLFFQIDRPGRYTLRWVVEDWTGLWGAPTPVKPHVVAASAWVEFDVLRSAPDERDGWLTRLLAEGPPADARTHASEYLPMVLAGLPDPRVADVLVDATYLPDVLVSSCAMNSLQFTPADVWFPAVLRAFVSRGLNQRLVGLVSFRSDLFQDLRAELVNHAIASVRADADAAVIGALNMVGIARHLDWRSEGAALEALDRAVLDAAPLLLQRSQPVVHALAGALGVIRLSDARPLLWRIADERPDVRPQALAAITWHADFDDIPRLAALLRTPPQESARELAHLPSLLAGYGPVAAGELVSILNESPDRWIRKSAAEVLMQQGRREGFQFALDAVIAGDSYGRELEEFTRTAFSLAPIDSVGMVAFLQSRVKSPAPPSPLASDLASSIARLHSTIPAERIAAADTLLTRASVNTAESGRVASLLIENVIRRRDQVNENTWRNAALIIGRLAGSDVYYHPIVTRLERDGAADALVGMGESVVPRLTEILTLAGPARRRIAAEVLGAIGGEHAREALLRAVNSDPDETARRAIQRALDRFGERPPPREFR
jgi:HEAT repeat protein